MSNDFGRDDPDDREPLSIDLSAVYADDALLDALSGSDPKVADELGAAELNDFLLRWSREVDSEPMPELVDVDTAVTTINSATLAKQHGRRGSKGKLLVPLAAAAAVLGIAFGGGGVAARDAQPGDTLWGLTKVLYANKASSVQASYDVRVEFKAAQDALDHGDLDKARDALLKAESRLPEVSAEDDRERLEQQHKQLMERLEAGPPRSEQQPSPTSKKPLPLSSPPPSSPAATVTPTPSEPATPSKSAPRNEPPRTTTSSSSTTTSSTTTSNKAAPTGSTSQPEAGSAGADGSSGPTTTQPVG